MLRGHVKYYDTELDRQVHYSVWGYALQQSLKLVLKPLTNESETYFIDDSPTEVQQYFPKAERLLEIFPTRTIVDTKLNEETIKAYPTTKTLPALMGIAYNLSIKLGEQSQYKIEKIQDNGIITYKFDKEEAHFDPKTKYLTPIHTSLTFPRREGAFNLHHFEFVSNTLEFVLDQTDEPDSEKLPYSEAKYTVTFKMDTVLKNLGLVQDNLEELDFTSNTERGMFLDTLQEVIDRHPNKNLSWILERDYHMVTDDTLEDTIKYLKTFPVLAVDTETTGLKITFKSKTFVQAPFQDQLTGIIISGKEGEAFFFPVRMNTVKNLCNGDHVYFMTKYMKPLLEKIPIVYFNVSFDSKVFMIYDIHTNIEMDVMVALQDTVGYENGIKRVSLKAMTSRFLNRDAIEISELTRTGSYDGANFADVPPQLVLAYACPDSDNTLGLYNFILQEKILESHNAVKLVKLDSHFALCIAYQEFYGQHIDVDTIPQLRQDLYDSLEDCKRTMLQCMKTVSKELVKQGLNPISEIDNFNPNSTPQLLKICYNDFKMPLQKKFDKNTRRFKPTLDKSARKTLLKVLKPGSVEYVFIKAFQDYSDSNTMVKNFTKNLNSMMSEDGYTFSQVDQFLNTGRLSTKEPPYQNYSKSIKPYIVPRPGFGMSDNDYQSIEYKIIAGLSGEKRLLDAFQDPNTDYHRLQASNMFGVPYALITDKMRQEAKGFNFGIPFGMGAQSLGELLRGSRSDENTAYAEKMLVKYFVGQDDVKAFFDNRRSWAVRDGYSETIMGRRRYYDKRTTSVGTIRRQAGNQPIQGSAADFFKLAVIRVYYKILERGWQGKILLSGFIHDEMLTEVHQSIHPIDYLSFIMEQVELRIDGFPPMFIGWGYGANWYQAKSVDVPTQLQYEILANGAEKEYPNWDGDNDKFYHWLEDRKFIFYLKELHLYLSNPVHDNEPVTPVALGYLKTAFTSEFNSSKALSDLKLEHPNVSEEDLNNLLKDKHLEFDLHRYNMFLDLIEFPESDRPQQVQDYINARADLPNHNTKELSMDEQFDLVLPFVALKERVHPQDPSLTKQTLEVEDEDNTSASQDIDYQDPDNYKNLSDSQTTQGYSDLSYEERVALREERLKQEQFNTRLNTFGNSPDLDNGRIIFLKDMTILKLVQVLSEDPDPSDPGKLTPDNGYYNVSVYDPALNQIINTPKLIKLSFVQGVIEPNYYKSISHKI